MYGIDAGMMMGALRAVYDLHERHMVRLRHRDGDWEFCSDCSVRYPCDTIRALGPVAAFFDEADRNGTKILPNGTIILRPHQIEEQP